MFNKVLIANRGAIATRIIRTLKDLDVTSVAIYADADTESRHVALADQALYLGDGNAAQTYLNQDKLFALMAEHGIDAVHPGYGFLSENPEFVERCENNGIAFIGPTAQQMRDFGLKHTARALAEDNDVPLLPGTGLLDDPAAALKAAAETDESIIRVRWSDPRTIAGLCVFIPLLFFDEFLAISRGFICASKNIELADLCSAVGVG